MDPTILWQKCENFWIFWIHQVTLQKMAFRVVLGDLFPVLKICCSFDFRRDIQLYMLYVMGNFRATMLSGMNYYETL